MSAVAVERSELDELAAEANGLNGASRLTR